MDQPDNDNPGAPLATPPARVAARLQRRSSSRRRSSAHSSRRSSISSLHSRASTPSCHGGPFSTHIAQHLRRASIIESRKARLAERAAHAEQVRLRAAAVKAAPRTSNSEEKALAAQAAREKLLAEITARCEEEVRRAKRIAEETKEKKAAEHARLEAQMAEKYADVARRRSIYQLNTRRPRTTSLAAVEEKKIEPAQLRKMTQNAAAKVIQRFWRRLYPVRIANAFMEAGIYFESMKEQDFEDVTRFIDTEDIMHIAMRIAKYLGLLDHEVDKNARRGAIRVFLSAFLIVSHPIQAFSHGGKEPQEQELTSKGQALTKAIEAAVDALSKGRPTPQPREELQQLFNDFTSGFHAWKSQDLGILADVLVGSFVNLDAVLQSTKDEEYPQVHEEYQQAVRTEQTKILVKLKRLLGPEKAMERLRKAVKKSRSERTGQKPKRTAAQVPRASTPVNMEIDGPSNTLSTPPATPAREKEKPETAISYLDQLARTMTCLPANREISHEIQVSKTYEIQQAPWTNQRKVLMDALKSGMRESIKDGNPAMAAAWTESMVVLVKSKLFNLLSQKHPLYEKIDNFLDASLIQQQIARGVFSYDEFFQTLGNMLKHLCSPGRDEVLKEFSEDTQSDMIDKLFKLINILDLMTLDHVNFQFRLATPRVLEHGHEHEAAMFAKDLEDRVHNLEVTRRWWKAGYTTVGTTVVARTPAHANAIYARALMDLIFSNNPVNYNQFPETLHLDFIRLLNIRARAFKIVAVASILLTSKIRLRRNREALWSREADQLMKLDFRATDVAAVVRQIESGHMMPDSTRSGLMDFVSRVLPSVAAAAEQLDAATKEHEASMYERRNFDPTLCQDSTGANAIFREQIACFILKSLREHFYTRVAATSTNEKVRVTSGTSATLARIGMPEFATAVGSIADEIQNMKNVDLHAHGTWYDMIAKELYETESQAV